MVTWQDKMHRYMKETETHLPIVLKIHESHGKTMRVGRSAGVKNSKLLSGLYTMLSKEPVFESG